MDVVSFSKWMVSRADTITVLRAKLATAHPEPIIDFVYDLMAIRNSLRHLSLTVPWNSDSTTPDTMLFYTLASLNHLRLLLLDGIPFDGRVRLSALQSLTTIHLLKGLEISPDYTASLSGICDAPALKTLCIHDISGTVEMDSVRHLTTLEHLELYGNEIWTNIVNDLSPLKDLTTLRHLEVDAWSELDLTPLYGLTNLTVLDLATRPLPPDGEILDGTALATLASRLPNLRYLGCRDASLPSFTHPTLEDLTFSIWSFAESMVDDFTWSGLSALKTIHIAEAFEALLRDEVHDAAIPIMNEHPVSIDLLTSTDDTDAAMMRWMNFATRTNGQSQFTLSKSPHISN